MWSILFNEHVKCLDYSVLEVDKRNVGTEHWWNDTVRRKPKYSEKNPSPRHFVHRKSRKE